MYIPPTPHLPVPSAWQYVLDVLDSIPPGEPLLLLGDLNAHLGGDELRRSPCPLHGTPRCQLPRAICSRGRMVQASLKQRSLHILNGCCEAQAHTCTSMQRGGLTARSAVDIMAVNNAALKLVRKFAIEDRPPRPTSKNYHSHLLLCTRVRPLQPTSSPQLTASRYKWVDGSEQAW